MQRLADAFVTLFAAASLTLLAAEGQQDSLRRQQSIEKRDSLRREKQQRDEEKAAEQERLRRERVARLEVGLVSQDPHTFQLNNPLRSSTRRPTGESAGQAAVVESTAF